MAASPNRTKASPGAARRSRAAGKTRRREKTLRLADLFMWIGIAEACLEHPVGGLERAALRLDVSAVDVQKCINRLEEFLGWTLIERRKARNPRVNSAQRGGHLSRNAVVFTEVCVCIEHLWAYAMKPVSRLEHELFLVKHFLFSELTVDITRGLERQRYGKLHELRQTGAGRAGQARLTRFLQWTMRESRQLQDGQRIDLGNFSRVNIPV